MGAATVNERLHGEILAMAKTLCSWEGEETILERLCTACEAELAAKLREGMTIEGCESAFVCAAAWLAAAAFESGQGGEGISSLRAGQLSVTAAGAEHRGVRSDLLRRSARALMEPYCRETHFGFCGVQG